jgi:lipopolysaccharide transport system permease protein
MPNGDPGKDPIHSRQRIRIRPVSGWVPLHLPEIWSYRNLLYFLTWRDVKVRYKQTLLGVAWAVIQPVFTMLVFSIFFGRLAKMPSDGIPYPLFAMSGLLPWQLFASTLTEASGSLVNSQNLLTKVYFPRLVLPLAAVMGTLLDFAISASVLLVMMLYYGVAPSVAIAFLPFFCFLALLTGLAVGIPLSALNVKYRDVRYTLPFLTQLWLFATPIAYPTSLVPDKWRLLYGLNPMASAVEGFRWALLGTGTGPGAMLLVSLLVVAGLLVFGLFDFRRREETFADLV